MKFVRSFKELDRNDNEIAGGKGASLGELTQAGIPVPAGFVVMAETFRSFLSDSGIHEELYSTLKDVPETLSVESASQHIQALILSKEIPDLVSKEILEAYKKLESPYVAVRSSATAEDGQEHAWAGQLESYLNTHEEQVLENVRKCWSSLFSPRAISYRIEKGLQDLPVSVAVVVQAMVESDVSGVAFSMHPVTHNQTQVVIEAGYGLGEAIVSGQVTPDSYLVEKGTESIVRKDIRLKDRGIFRGTDGNDWKSIDAARAQQPALTDEQIQALALLVVEIEQHYAFPVDIEWALKDDNLFILQSRPITTIKKSPLVVRPHARDFIFTFEAEGVTPLFQEIVSKAYSPSESLLLCVKGTVRSFVSKETVQRMRIEGAAFFADIPRVEKTLEELGSLIVKANTEMSGFSEDKRVSFEDAERCLQMMEEIHALYGRFDTAYTDGAFEASGNTLSPGLEIVEKHKNPIREQYNELFFVDEGGFILFLGAISKEFGMSINDLCWCLEAEILEILAGGALPAISIASRKQAYVFHKTDAGTNFLEGDEAKSLIEAFQDVVPDGVADITGTPAHATGSVVRGKVCVINSDYFDLEKVKGQMTDMENGSVLVSVTTAPDLMEAIQKASAIVTDVGGMLSHAAITARELNIPCIVGTQFASKILKDGDVVEIDAARGTVRILA